MPPLGGNKAHLPAFWLLIQISMAARSRRWSDRYSFRAM